MLLGAHRDRFRPRGLEDDERLAPIGPHGGGDVGFQPDKFRHRCLDVVRIGPGHVRGGRGKLEFGRDDASRCARLLNPLVHLTRAAVKRGLHDVADDREAQEHCGADEIRRIDPPRQVGGIPGC